MGIRRGPQPPNPKALLVLWYDLGIGQSRKDVGFALNGLQRPDCGVCRSIGAPVGGETPSYQSVVGVGGHGQGRAEREELIREMQEGLEERDGAVREMKAGWEEGDAGRDVQAGVGEGEARMDVRGARELIEKIKRQVVKVEAEVQSGRKS